MEFNSINVLKLKYQEIIKFKYYEWFYIHMFLQLISIPGWDSKSWTMLIWPCNKANIKGVSLNIGIQFHDYLKLKCYEIIKFKYY